jgi:hypothetical protein
MNLEFQNEKWLKDLPSEKMGTIGGDERPNKEFDTEIFLSRHTS